MKPPTLMDDELQQAAAAWGLRRALRALDLLARAHARILTQAIRTESLKSSFRSVSQGRVRHEP